MANPGIINTPLNRRKLDKQKFTGWSVDKFTQIYGQKTERAAVCLTRPATDPALTGVSQALHAATLVVCDLSSP